MQQILAEITAMVSIRAHLGFERQEGERSYRRDRMVEERGGD